MSGIRSIRLLLICSLACAAGGAAPARAQSPGPPPGIPATLTVELVSTLRDSVISLPHQFLDRGSDTLVVIPGGILRRATDYTIDYRHGIVRFTDAFRLAANADTAHRMLRITYRSLPFRFQSSYSRRTVTVLRDSAGGDTISIARPRGTIGIDDIFGREVHKSGSIFRGFTVGSNRDLAVNSGFRMQLAGAIAPEVEVTASLTDENTPIQPEGTTQTLQEFDNVFVEIKSGSYGATLGDFTVDLRGQEFASLSRKLQGAQGFARFPGPAVGGDLLIAGASTRGKYQSNQFQGIEGVQGPYRLTGRNNERSLIVIAGTERVYLNGELQVRGEANDYTIDYTTAEVWFTPRRLMTGSSRLVIDFEYTDRQYARSLIAGRGGVTLGSAAALTFSYAREADDPDAPIDLTLSEGERQILEEAGNDQAKAVISGVTRVDSNGLYIQVDTILTGGIGARFYRYAPGDSAALFLVRFSDVGAGRGEYIRRRVGEFEWRGPGGGEYLPVVVLPFAELSQVMDLKMDLNPGEELQVSGEFARSLHDPNRFSTLDGDIAGNAISAEARYRPREIRAGDLALGSLDLRIKGRWVQDEFHSLDRTNDVEFNRRWAIDSLRPGDEQLQEASLLYSPLPALSFGTGYGKIVRGETFRSVRNDGVLTLRGQDLPQVRYTVEDVRSTDGVAGLRSDWLRQNGSADYQLWNLVPSLRFESERRLFTDEETGRTAPGSFSFGLIGPGLNVTMFGPLSLGVQLEWRSDDAMLADVLQDESSTFTHAYAVRLSPWNDLSLAADVSLRRREFTAAFAGAGKADTRSVVVRSQTRYAPLERAIEADWLYTVVTERSAQVERVFVRVQKGTGSYRYMGDVNGNGVADDSEFVPVRFDGDYDAVFLSSDVLVPVIDLTTALRLRLAPQRMLPRGEGGLVAILRALSTETYVRVEEKSAIADPEEIYLLRLSRFQNDSTTLNGSRLFTQDFWVLEGEQVFSARLRFLERTGLIRFSSGAERVYLRERSLRLRWQMVAEIAAQIDLLNKLDRLTGGDRVGRNRDIAGNSVSLDLSYRPDQLLELGVKLDVGRSTDAAGSVSRAADLNAQTVRLVYSLLGAGQARGEFAREEILLQRGGGDYPFELTGGRLPGRTWLWRGSFEYRVTRFLQASVSYDGRSEGGAAPVHTGRAEVRAFF